MAHLLPLPIFICLLPFPQRFDSECIYKYIFFLHVPRLLTINSVSAPTTIPSPMRPDVGITFGALSRQHAVIPSPLPAVVELPFPLMRHFLHQTDKHVQMVNRHLSRTVRAAVRARSYSSTLLCRYTFG